MKVRKKLPIGFIYDLDYKSNVSVVKCEDGELAVSNSVIDDIDLIALPDSSSSERESTELEEKLSFIVREVKLLREEKKEWFTNFDKMKPFFLDEETTRRVNYLGFLDIREKLTRNKKEKDISFNDKVVFLLDELSNVITDREKQEHEIAFYKHELSKLQIILNKKSNDLEVLETKQNQSVAEVYLFKSLTTIACLAIATILFFSLLTS